MAARCLLLKYAWTGGKPELVALQITDWADNQYNSEYTKFCNMGSVITFSVEDRICISRIIYSSLKSDHYLLWMFLACTFSEFVHKCKAHDATISVTCLFKSVLQAKNRELLKQVAALSKGKKFDKSGSILTSPWGTGSLWGLLLNVHLSNSVKPLKSCVVEKIFLHTRLVGMFPTCFYN